VTPDRLSPTTPARIRAIETSLTVETAPEAGQRGQREADRGPHDPQAVAQLQADRERGLEQSGGHERHPCHHVTSRKEPAENTERQETAMLASMLPREEAAR
jgi:hypothetical protein